MEGSSVAKKRIDEAVEIVKAAGIKLLPDEEKAVRQAFSSQGSYAGFLRRSCPPRKMGGLAAAAWLGLQPNYHKLSIGRALTLDSTATAFMTRLIVINWPLRFDRDAWHLYQLGVWP